MPTYCYSSESGATLELLFKMGDAPMELVREKERFYRDFGAEQVSRPSRTGWPIECVASGVNANQAGELRDFFKKHGESVEVSRDGNPIYTSANQRRRLLKLRGFVDHQS